MNFGLGVAILALIAGFALSGCAPSHTSAPEQTPNQSETILNYGRSIQQAIAKNWIPPRTTSSARCAAVVLLVTTDRSGQLLEALVEKSSEVALLDDEALAVVHRSSPFGDVPTAFAGERFQVRLDFRGKDCLS